MVTFEISGADIRILSINGRRITGWANASIDPDWYEEGIVSNHQALAREIRQLIASSGIKDKNIIAGINGLYSLSRVVSVPVSEDPATTRRAIAEAAELLMPLSMDDMYFSWHTVSRNNNVHLASVIGVPRDILDSEMRVFRTAGFTPHTLDLKTLALARAVRKDNAVILNIDAASFDIVILAGGFPEVQRSTAWQSDELSIEEQSDKLVSALELTIDFYNTHHPDLFLGLSTVLFITGHLSGNQTLVQNIKNNQPYVLEELSPPFDCPPHFPVSEYAVGIGLAMKETTSARLNLAFFNKNINQVGNENKKSTSVPDLNLLPAIYKPWKPSSRQISYSVALVGALALILPFYNMATAAMNDTATVRQRYNTVNLVMDKRRAELAKREPFQKAITQYDAIVAMGGGFVDDITAIRKLAGELKVKTDIITHSNNAVTFNCEAPDYIVFRDFIAALEVNGRFTSPIIPPEGYPYIRGGTVSLTQKR